MDGFLFNGLEVKQYQYSFVPKSSRNTLTKYLHIMLWYEHGTHFAFPESMLKMMLPVGSGLLVSYMFKAGKEHKKEYRDTRIDIDRRLKKALVEW